MTTKTFTDEWIGKCDGHAIVVGDETAQARGYRVRCAEHRRHVRLDQIETRPGVRECGAWCTDGTGKSCTCTCGGANHGATWRTK